MNTITGSKEAFPQPTSYGRNDAGQFSTIPFESTDADKINALASQFDALGYSYQVEHSFGKSKITVQLSFNQLAQPEVPVDLWEYNGNTAQKDLLSANVPSGITQKLTPGNTKLIRDGLAGTLPEGFTPSGSHVDLEAIDFGGTQDQQNAAYALYIMMKTGYTDAYISVPILRHTQTVSANYPISLTTLNVGNIFTTSTLISLENPPNWAVTGLPNDVPPNINNIILGYGWMKFAPTIQQIAGRKFQIVQEFQYGLWPVGTMGVNGLFL